MLRLFAYVSLRVILSKTSLYSKYALLKFGVNFLKRQSRKQTAFRTLLSINTNAKVDDVLTDF